ncbi:MAG: hypothetical protein A2126_02765 [Candidatus Woykebacteria bacterium GWB1_45_5]|uniref:Type II secretion system protein GspG C-terminal domain-containing protein n=2 Tax=Candidatus Woykeibacteriota TaxID=1817899 RepID=A0A1G1W023_9BACT|nr:MAG: hypothetical protein A2113_01405 [Candidatus Woykebacteria bacterium GWA1_44_8]OGY24741.1 MAG: hypothetical protein A2126_02765 [Candidatus Woykebacteria bacterium GWB1_45_5]
MADFVPEKEPAPAGGRLKRASNPFDLRNIEKSTYLHLAGFLGIAVLVAAVFYVYLRFDQERLLRDQNGTEKTRTSSQSQNLSQIQLQAEQDQQRRNDVDTLNSALKSFYLKEKRPPDLLKELIPDYLKKLLTDPVTKKEYSYKLSQDKKSWQVAATLSNGNKFEVKGP